MRKAKSLNIILINSRKKQMFSRLGISKRRVPLAIKLVSMPWECVALDAIDTVTLVSLTSLERSDITLDKKSLSYLTDELCSTVRKYLVRKPVLTSTKYLTTPIAVC